MDASALETLPLTAASRPAPEPGTDVASVRDGGRVRAYGNNTQWIVVASILLVLVGGIVVSMTANQRAQQAAVEHRRAEEARRQAESERKKAEAAAREAELSRADAAERSRKAEEAQRQASADLAQAEALRREGAGTQAATTASATIQPGTDSSEWQQFHDAGQGFRVAFPRGWTVSQQKVADGLRFRFDDPARTAAIMIDVGAWTDKLSALDNWRVLDQRFGKVFRDKYSRTALQEGKFGGQPGACWEFTVQRPGQPNKRSIDWCVQLRAKRYAMLCTAPVADFEKWRPRFDQAITSFGLD